jgi:uncharacterized phage protein (TIGR01671 family)
MREIRFRVWDRENREFITINNPGNRPIAEAYERILITLDGLVFYWDGKNRLQSHLFTIQQYTGLNDKNKKPIFEGDIVSCADFYDPALVSWDEFYNGFCLEWKPTDKRRIPVREPLCSDSKLKIIGNTMQNPELLDKK